MTHETRYVINGRIESTDSTLLDTIESELPDEGDTVLGNEYDLSRSSVLDDEGNETGAEVLSGRMTFAPDGSEFTLDADGNITEVEDSSNYDSANIFGPAEASQQFYQTIVSHDLAAKADGWRVWVYQSPEGGVTASDVRDWYEADESRQPTRTVEQDDGTTTEESYVPSSFDPQNHKIMEESA